MLHASVGAGFLRGTTLLGPRCAKWLPANARQRLVLRAMYTVYSIQGLTQKTPRRVRDKTRTGSQQPPAL